MKHFFRYLLVVFLFPFIFTSCEVEFDPNEEWKAVTVVYGVLDQDDDTTFVRVQKGFLALLERNKEELFDRSRYAGCLRTGNLPA